MLREKQNLAKLILEGLSFYLLFVQSQTPSILTYVQSFQLRAQIKQWMTSKGEQTGPATQSMH